MKAVEMFNIDAETFCKEIEQIKSTVESDLSQQDLKHLQKFERWSRLCALGGLGTAWIIPNPFSAYLISQAKVGRWAVSHSILHKAYDRIPDIPPRYTSNIYGRGWRRLLDWMDWLDIEAWNYEHNVLHHYHLLEDDDPDHVEINSDYIRASTLPVWVKYTYLFLIISTWRFTYYTTKVLTEVQKARARRETGQTPDWLHTDLDAYNPFHPRGKEVWLKSYLPYTLWTFVLIPLLFAPFGWLFAINVLINMMLAEWITNLHTFTIIATNHSGDDMYGFSTKMDSKAEFYVRQIIGTTNYPYGTDLLDFVHGGLNYHIEHHLFPQMTTLQYQKANPLVKALCKRHKLPYVQENMFQRLAKTLRVMVGESSIQIQHANPQRISED